MNLRNPSHRERRDVERAGQRASQLFSQGRHEDALLLCLQVARRWPQLPAVWTDAAVNCVKLGRWEEAIDHAHRALRSGGESLALFDALSHAHGGLRQWEQVRTYGLRALNLREARFGQAVPIAHESPPLPPPPCAESRAYNLIAFSLFGGNSKYCETAVLNVLEQPRLYPGWTCRFYIDDSVPAAIVQRLLENGGQVVRVDETARQWPGPMWRFLALEDPQARRILFRDADSVISQREAEAVQQWLDSGTLFHAMRDNSTHTELLLAGLWGCVGGALPPLRELARRFFAEPLASRHFADQYFLRQYVWPYARLSLLQHDSMFGFLGAAGFPGGPMPEDFHVGYAEGSPWFSLPCTLPEGSIVRWTFLHREGEGERAVCDYPATVSGGKVQGHLPARYADQIRAGKARIVLAPA
ncbi:tetratricopeptide repeat protein [Pseudomonas otitidis]|uniref:tetratricopeptide repeat protein n=1 Tax=Metapseudomonas otitidis TaxID=319939 RepID=UPI0024AE7567|nr:tetratricopeptide repeat protein [Pseudomonas otitidis]MDI6529055.1 tetratricopeptide repeat protein [Pseudomonas otitidis]